MFSFSDIDSGLHFTTDVNVAMFKGGLRKQQAGFTIRETIRGRCNPEFFHGEGGGADPEAI
jgi:hypothetical protein